MPASALKFYRAVMRLRFFDDPGPFLDLAGTYLGADPVLNTVVASVAERDRRERGEGVRPGPDDWYLAVEDAGIATTRVVGVAMRTARHPPRPVYLLTMAAEAARQLARSLFDRGEEVGGANGALPAAEVFASESAGLSGARVEVAAHTRLFELTEVIEPTPVPGSLRPAGSDDFDLVLGWWAAFRADADAQAGRTPAEDEPVATQPPAAEVEMIRRRVRDGLVWLWTDPAGRPVHLTAANAVSSGAQRIGPVFTPAEHRGHGYASRCVAEVSSRILAAGARPCLFTDQANPVSNAIYVAIGYRPVVDMVNLAIVPTLER